MRLRPPCDASTLTAEISTALGAHGLTALTIDLDGADFLGDDIAAVLRRARAAAHAHGIALHLHATRAGALRWLRRHRFKEVSS